MSIIRGGAQVESELEEDMRVRVITQSVIDFVKGMQPFNGEEVVELMMDVAYGRTIDKEDLKNLIYAVMDKQSPYYHKHRWDYNNFHLK